MVTATLIAWFSLGQIQTYDLSRLVSADVPVSQASKALEKLAQQINVPLRATGDAGNEVIFIHVDNRPIREVMDRIADTTKGEWKISADGAYSLVRTPAIVRAEETKQVTLIVKKIEDWRKKQTENLLTPFDASHIQKTGYRYLRMLTIGEHDGYSELEQQDPVYRAYSKCLPALNLNKMARLRVDQQIVYSTLPTRTQEKLPATIPQELIEEHRAWCQQMNGISWTADNGTAVDAFRKYDSEEDYPIRGGFETSEPFRHSPYLAFISVWREDNDQLDITFQVVSQSGKPIIRLTDTISIDIFNDSDMPEREGTKALPLPKPSISSLAFWNPDGNEKVGLNSRDAWSKFAPFAENPTVHDPLAVGHQELLDSLAAHAKKSVIACIPDAAEIGYGGDFSFKMYFQDCFTPWSYRESLEWIELFPHDYLGHWRSKVSRPRLAAFNNAYRLTKNFDLKGYVGLNCGELGFSAWSLGANVAKDYMGFPKFDHDLEISSHPALLHLLSSLTDDQFDRLCRGQIIPYQLLSSSQLEMARDVIFRPPGDILVGGKAANPMAELDPTFELPNGILDGPGIGMEVIDEDISVITDPREARTRIVESLSDRKEEFVYLNTSTCTFGKVSPDKSMRFENCKRRRITLRCYLSRNHWFADDFLEPVRPTDGVKRRFGELPKNLRSAILSRGHFLDLAHLRDQLKKFIKAVEESENKDLLTELRNQLKDIEDRLTTDPPEDSN